MGNAIYKFIAVGAAGFVVDVGGLYVLTLAGGDPLTMRFVTFLVAVVVTWIGNRYWTFADQATGGLVDTFIPYLGVQSLGLVVNYAMFATVLGFLTPTAAYAALAATIGSVTAIVVTFLGTSFVVFGDRQTSRPTR